MEAELLYYILARVVNEAGWHNLCSLPVAEKNVSMIFIVMLRRKLLSLFK